MSPKASLVSSLIVTGLGALAVVSCEAPSRAAPNNTPVAAPAPPSVPGGPTSRANLVANYDALADEILGTRKREVEIVRSILDATFVDAAASKNRCLQTLKAGDAKGAQSACEDLATLVAQLATEGDASVARVRKRLIEGGHHFNPLPVGGEAPGGAHHGDAGNPAHHTDGKAPTHHADGKAPAHHADGQAPAHNADGKAPGHHADGKAPAHNTDSKAPAHHADGKSPAHHADGKAPAHHADGKSPAHHSLDPSHHAQHAKDPAHHAQHRAQHANDGHHTGASALGYDPGCVVVNRGAKKVFLEASRALAQLSTAPAADTIDAEWKKVEAAWTGLDGNSAK